MIHYVKVVPKANIPLTQNQLFTYQTEEDVQIGQEVIIPLRNQILRGIVWNLEKEKPRFEVKKIIEVVDQKPVLSLAHFKLALWISYYYHCSLGLAVKLFLPSRLKRRLKKQKVTKAKNRQNFPPSNLTTPQKKALATITKSRKQFFLLHGVTGSGKTEIYLRLCAELVKQGKQVIILVPEISLTHQAIDRFSTRFPGKIAVIHSRLSRGERFRDWERIRAGLASIVIGPRSAIFAPVSNLGLIVLDEEHDSSFKQYDQTPRYQAREIAWKLAEITGAKMLLGSATPSLESYFQARRGELVLLELPQRIGKIKMPLVEIVDMRREFKRGRHSVFSERLQEELQKIIACRKQAILFVNRRGAATFVFCRECGYVLHCPHCDVSLTYHLGVTSQLICHYCHYTTPPPPFCPRCQSPEIKYYGLGTQRVESELKNILPKAIIARFDRDATLHRNEHKKIYYDFVNHKIDLLVGTQMLTQGWDLPKVSLIGIISADLDLNLPDFRATERAFQLLTQVAGRTGRGKEIGEVILQTYNPENSVIRTASTHNYSAFFQEEVKNRKELGFPPYSKIIKLIYQGYKKEKVEKEALILAQTLKSYLQNHKLLITLLGPAPTFIPRIRRRYRYQIILMFKPESLEAKSKILAQVPSDWIIDVDPESLL